MLARWKISYDQHRQHIKKQRHYFANKGPCSQSYGFSSSHVWMWELDHEESWALKNWCFWTVVLEKTLERPLDCKEIKPINPKGNQFWIVIGRTDAEDETPILWPPDVKNWHLKRPWCWESLRAGGEGDDRGWDGWMASLTRWTWVWASSGSWWWTGRPGVLQSMGSQRVRHNWMTELNWKVSELVQRVLMYPFPTSPKDDILHTHSLLSIIKTLFDFPIFHRHQLCVCVSIRFHQMYINRCVCTPP